MNASKQQILDFAKSNRTVSASILVQMCGMNQVTARQYLCSLAKDKELVRVCAENNVGFIAMKGLAGGLITRSEAAMAFISTQPNVLPIWGIQREHELDEWLSYFERDAIETVFARLRDRHKNVYRQPNTAFMYDYVDLRSDCIIVKTLVTESPLMKVEGICVPTLEKMLIDTQKDADFDYLRGTESQYMFQLAFDLYTINTQRLLRYARRRNIEQETQELINLIEK